MKELLEVRLDAVLVLAQRDLDVLGLYRVVQGCLLRLKLVQAMFDRRILIDRVSRETRSHTTFSYGDAVAVSEPSQFFEEA